MVTRFLFLLSAAIFTLAYAWSNQPQLPKPGKTQFTKIDEAGNAINLWAGPWDCVLDTYTGLLWEVKTDAESIHHGDWTYSWFIDETGVANNGDCYFEQNRCDTDDLIRRVNQKMTCGMKGWRLPTAAELESLVSHRAGPGGPTIDQDFFPHTKRGDYWTADHEVPLQAPFSYLGVGAKAVNFIDGRSVRLPYRNAAYVRLVVDSVPTIISSKP